MSFEVIFNFTVFGPFENNTIGNVEENLFTDWNAVDNNFDDANDDDTTLQIFSW